jgi:hypothetical protein
VRIAARARRGDVPVAVIVVVAVLLVLAGGVFTALVARRIAITREASALAARGLTRANVALNAPEVRAAKLSPKLCPVCATGLNRFETVGLPGTPGERADARCPSCRSLERHRQAWLYLLNETDLLVSYEQKSILYLCGDELLLGKLREQGEPARLTGDLTDVTLVDCPSASFDAVFCCDVLEYVPDDIGLVRELHRVLKPSGWALLLVGVYYERTVDLAAAGDSRVRAYGADVATRLGSAGMAVTVDQYVDRLGRDRCTRYGLRRAETLYCCTPA